MSQLESLLGALAAAPALPGAACRGEHDLYDAAADGDPAAVELASMVCGDCVCLAACQEWVDSLPKRKRPLGICGGRLFTEGTASQRRAPTKGGVVMPAGLVVAGGAVVLTGDWLHTTRQAVLIAARTRRVNGLPASAAHNALTEALADAMAANGHAGVPELVDVQRFPAELPTVTVDDAAQQIGLSRRQTRRLAPRLGGKIIAGRWLLDQVAINEHIAGGGNRWTETA